MKISRVCELCNGEAAAYCPADNAFLCWTCDAKVHEANFLVARHVRQIICHNCKGFTGDRISGMGFQAFGSICPSCLPASATGGHDLDSLSSSSSSSACVSSTQSSSCAAAAAATATSQSGNKTCATTRKGQRRRRRRRRPWRVVDSKAEGIFVNWCARLGLSGGDSADVVRMACDALGVCLDQLTILPFRVSLAASLWFAFRFCQVRSLSTWQAIKRLEEISGVPAKLISAAESKLQRLFKAARKQRRQCHHHQLPEESWAES